MKKINLRISRPMIIMFGMVAAVMTVQQGYAQGASKTCSLATLKGRYQFASAGYLVMNGAALPLAVAGIDILDGNGNISSNSTLIVGGAVIFQNLIVPNGTYTVRKDCTGTLTLGASGVVLDIFVAPDGEAYDYVQTAPSGNILAGTIRKVSDGTEAEQ
jgi:hypothetical protein